MPAQIAIYSAPSPLLNLGSSSRHFREREKPHIDQLLFAPLRAAGVEIVHSDLMPDDGVDLAGDIRDPQMIARLRAHGFRAVLASNLLEHVRGREAVAAACEEIVGPGGLILATVPSSFPYHADPLDTLYRPSPAALAALFTRSETLVAEELRGRTFGEDLRSRGASVAGEIGRTRWWTRAACVRPRSALSRLDRWRWYRRPYRVSIVMMRVSR